MSEVITYPVMQVHGSLALEDNSEVGEAWYWAEVVFPYLPKSLTHSLQWVLLGKDLVIPVQVFLSPPVVLL